MHDCTNTKEENVVIFRRYTMHDCTNTKEENVVIFRRYIAEISCIRGYRHDISWRNIGPAIFHGEILIRRYFGINPEKSVISRDISAIFPDISHGQRGSTKVKRATVKSMCYSATTVSSPFASEEI